MNNYIDERMISYRRPYRTSTIIKTNKESAVLSTVKKAVRGAAKILAVIFLLVVSTFSGVDKSSAKKSNVSVKRATRNIILCVAFALLVWGALIAFDYIVKLATLMPIWLFIGGFALVVLSLGKVVSK